MDEGAQNQRIREHLWQHLESEHRQLNKVLGDVESLAAEGSFETARKRFGEYRLAHERHLVTERKLVRRQRGFIVALTLECQPLAQVVEALLLALGLPAAEPTPERHRSESTIEYVVGLP